MKLNNVPESLPPARSTYRHGDLRRALLEAGVELARDGGPDAVVLREATRRVGVVPNAAYRHFGSRQELLLAVRGEALAAAAKAMEKELAVLHFDQPPADFARAQVRAIGTAYLRFAQAEPGLFRTAFVVTEEGEGEVGPGTAAGASGMGPFQLLGGDRPAGGRRRARPGAPPECRIPRVVGGARAGAAHHPRAAAHARCGDHACAGTAPHRHGRAGPVAPARDIKDQR
jgi:AcrR family transcriptional regulator